MSQTQYTRLTTAQFNTLNAATVGSLYPYQIEQIKEYLGRINWGNANSQSGEGSQSDVSGQPTLTQIVTLAGSNNP